MGTLPIPPGHKVEKMKKLYGVDYVVTKDGRVRMAIEIKVRKKHYPQMMISLTKVQALRDLASMGVQSRVIFATPEGVFSKAIGPGPIDGWIGTTTRADREDSTELAVYFGDWQVRDKLYEDEKNPMTRIGDSRMEWFA